jgi:hypothetical protein
MPCMKFIEIVSLLKTLVFIQLHQSLFIILNACVNFIVFTSPKFFLILPSIHFISYTIVHKFSDHHHLPWSWSTGTVVLHMVLLSLRWQYIDPTNSHSEHSCFKWPLNGILFTGMCSYDLNCPGMTTRSVSIAWVMDLMSSVRWSSDASNISILCFLNSNIDLLFQITRNQSPVSFFNHLALR